MKNVLAFIVMTGVLAGTVLSCSSGGGGGGGGGPALVTLSSVTALYPVNGSKWNDYVSSSTGTATDTACDAATDTACVHGGEKRVVTVKNKSFCTGLTATDALGAFDWTCDASTGTARFISTGLKSGKHLSDLLNFTTPGWNANSVTVNDGGTLYSTATVSNWWANPVVSNITGGSLASASTIYLVTSSMTGSYTFGASKIALVTKPGTTITGPGAGSGSYVINADNLSGGAKNYLWFEGVVNTTGDDAGVNFEAVKYSVLDNVQAWGASNGVAVSFSGVSHSTMRDVVASHSNYGVSLTFSTDNWLTRIVAQSNKMMGVFLGLFSDNNTLSNILSTKNGNSGVELNLSSQNRLMFVSASSNTGHGVTLANSSSNVLRSLRISNNGNTGVFLSDSTGNRFADVFAANNFHGIYLTSASHDNWLQGITISNNSINGVTVSASSNNVISDAAALNNINIGIALSAASGNVLSNTALSYNDFAGYYMETTSDNNRFSGLLKVGYNSWDCLVSTTTVSPGLDDDADPSDVATDVVHDKLCTQQGFSDFGSAVTGLNLPLSFIGPAVSDTVQSSTTGTAAYAGITDWVHFENEYRGWGKDGTFGFADSKGQCTSGTCRIWDWSLASADSAIKGVLSIPTGTNTLIHTWSNASTTEFLRNAIELTGDGVGNDDLLCESNETCLYTPNIGAYQGHGNLVSAGTFTNGTITGVTLMKYETNGR